MKTKKLLSFVHQFKDGQRCEVNLVRGRYEEMYITAGPANFMEKNPHLNGEYILWRNQVADEISKHLSTDDILSMLAVCLCDE
jgi:hypothetical protein